MIYSAALLRNAVTLLVETMGGIISVCFFKYRITNVWETVEPDTEEQQKLNVLCNVAPFCFMPREKLQILADESELRRYRHQGTVICDRPAIENTQKLCKGDDGSTFIVVEGKVATTPGGRIRELISEETMFGIDYAVLGLRRKSTRTVYGESTVVLAIPAKAVEESLKNMTEGVRASITRIFTERVPLGPALSEFKSAVRDGVRCRRIHLPELLEVYKKITPVLHRHILDDDSTLDTVAWKYAVERLPKSLLSTHLFLLTTRLADWLLENPPLLADNRVTSKKREREAYRLGESKTAVVLREFESDLLDFMSIICIHCIESRKLRHLLVPEWLSVLQSDETDALDALEENNVLSSEERKGLQAIWPNEVCANILKVIQHHEDYQIALRKPRTMNLDSSERWVHQLWDRVRRFVDICPEVLVPGDLCRRDDVVVDVFQGSTRTFLASFGFLSDTTDLPSWIVKIDGCTEFTGVKVILVNALDESARSRMCANSGALTEATTCHLIINIGYAFGVQSTDIIRGLIMLFGTRIRSANIVGKAGGIKKELKKRDILVASTAVINDNPHDVVHLVNPASPSSNGSDIRIDTSSLKSEPNVHSGPMLTIAGTILQKETLLLFYRNIWNCIGVEMEAYYYAKEIARGKQFGMLDKNLSQRYLYYVSDLPLEGNTLAEDSFEDGIDYLKVCYEACFRCIFDSDFSRKRAFATIDS